MHKVNVLFIFDFNLGTISYQVPYDIQIAMKGSKMQCSEPLFSSALSINPLPHSDLSLLLFFLT